MSRILILTMLLLLLDACSAGERASNSSVDINVAATRAQQAVDAYGANTAADPVDRAKVAMMKRTTPNAGLQAQGMAQ